VFGLGFLSRTAGRGAKGFFSWFRHTRLIGEFYPRLRRPDWDLQRRGKRPRNIGKAFLQIKDFFL
jgi:hypothetical protein